MPNYHNETVTYEAELKHKTDKSWLFVIDGEDVWVPFSLGEWYPKSNRIDGEIEVPTWWAEKNNLA